MSIELISRYHQVEKYRQAFIEFIPQIFSGASFAEWHKRGYWQDDFQAHAIYDHHQEQMLANVSLGLMDVYIDGQLKKGAQLSSVGVLPQARKRGYQTQLMAHIFALYANQVDLFFLFGNPSVVDFYPRFGFHQVAHHNFKASYPANVSPRFAATQLDIDQPQDWAIISDFSANRAPVTTLFGTTNEANVLNWSLLNPFQKKIWHLPTHEVVVVAETKEGVLHIYDIMSKQPLKDIHFNEILASISLPDTHTLMFYFTPEKLPIQVEAVPADESAPFFVKGDFLPKGTHFMFPMLART